MTSDEEAVAEVLSHYEQALNASDLEAAVSVYEADGVFMPQHSPSSIGVEAIRRAYKGIFEQIQLTVSFSVAEIKQLSPDWILARTNSAGTVKVHATGQGGPEANQELFLFSKGTGVWKIARYCFSTTNPPKA